MISKATYDIIMTNAEVNPLVFFVIFSQFILWFLFLLSASIQPSSTTGILTTLTLDSRHWNDHTYSKLMEKVRECIRIKDVIQ